MKYACPCCGFETLDEAPPGTYDICEICFWEDDAVQFHDPDYTGGANVASLREAKANFIFVEAIKKAAFKEIEEQSFELTKQFLSVNKLVYMNNKPEIVDVIIKDEKQAAEVYFSIFEEKYYFVVYLDTWPEVEVRFVGMSAGSRVYLTVTSSITSLEKLLKGINLIPLKTWKKGTRISEKIRNRYYEDSGFTIEYDDKKTGEIEDKIVKLVSSLEASNLSHIVESEGIRKVVQVVYYGYKEQMWGIHLKPMIIEKLAKLKASLDIDLYASGPDLE